MMFSAFAIKFRRVAVTSLSGLIIFSKYYKLTTPLSCSLYVSSK